MGDGWRGELRFRGAASRAGGRGGRLSGALPAEAQSVLWRAPLALGAPVGRGGPRNETAGECFPAVSGEPLRWTVGALSRSPLPPHLTAHPKCLCALLLSTHTEACRGCPAGCWGHFCAGREANQQLPHHPTPETPSSSRLPGGWEWPTKCEVNLGGGLPGGQAVPGVPLANAPPSTRPAPPPASA